MDDACEEEIRPADEVLSLRGGKSHQARWKVQKIRSAGAWHREALQG